MNKIQLYITIIFFFFNACANQGMPSGGPKDIIPPVVKKTVPANYSINFKQKQIILTFSEYIKLHNIRENLLISPPQKRQPKIKEKGKSIEINFVDTLLENTTYIVDLSNTIVDLNESLPLRNFRFVFSTGNIIDSIHLSGFIKNAFDHSVPDKKTIVCLFDVNDNIDLHKKFPIYMTNVDSNGYYLFTNISDNEYNIIGFQDLNKNNRIDVGEPRAFLDSSIIPSNYLTYNIEGHHDTSKIYKSENLANISYLLYLFEDKSNKQYLKNYEREKKYKLSFYFNIPRQDTLLINLLGVEEKSNWALLEQSDTLLINLLGVEEKSNWALLEQSATKDTLIYWIVDSSIYNLEKLSAELQYLKTDSNDNLKLFVDTVSLKFKEKESKKTKKGKSKRQPNLKIKDNLAKTVHPSQKLYIEFEQPVRHLQAEKIKVYHLVEKQKNAMTINLVADTLKAFRKYWLFGKFLPGESYEIEIDSATINSIYNLSNSHYKKQFNFKESTYYGKIFVTLNNIKGNVIVQLISAKNKIKYVQKANKKKIVAFNYVEPGTYMIKIIKDKNMDNKWTSGNFIKKIQPEQVVFYNEEIELKSNWEINILWNLK